MSHPATAVSAFYRTAMLALRVLEAREGRGQRFGDTALARWKSFAGALEDRDRLDLFIRAAQVTAPLAFAPRSVFRLEGLADDEPFGPRWDGPPKGLASELLRDAAAPLSVPTLRELLDVARTTWSIPPFSLPPVLAASFERLSPSTKILLAGADAITGLVVAAQGRSDLDLATQVVLLADDPVERQLFGLGLILLQARGRGQALAAADATPSRVRALGFARVDLALVSEDAAVAAREAVHAVAAELGG